MFRTDGAPVTNLGHDEGNANGGNPWKEDILPKDGKELHVARRGMCRQPGDLDGVVFIGGHLL